MDLKLIHKLITSPVDPEEKFRITRDTLFVATARLVSYRGTCNRSGRAGAVIVKDGRIISIGYAGSPPGMPHCIDVGHQMHEGHCIRTQHAEANAIAWAARSGVELGESTMYCTVLPCMSCAKIIVMAGIKRVVFINSYQDKLGLEYLRDTGVHVEAYCGSV